jgi:hypothetical protein
MLSKHPSPKPRKLTVFRDTLQRTLRTLLAAPGSLETV